MPKKSEPEDPFVPLHPLIHGMQLHVGDNVVDELETHRASQIIVHRLEVWELTITFNQRVDRVTVRLEAGHHLAPPVGLQHMRLVSRPARRLESRPNQMRPQRRERPTRRPARRDRGRPHAG